MEENEDFLDGELENVRVSNTLNNQNGPGYELSILSELNEAGNELPFNQEDNEINNYMDEVCNNLAFGSIICFIQSLISIGLFYLYYIYKFTIEDSADFIAVEISLFIILLALLAIIVFSFFKVIGLEYLIGGGYYTLFILIFISQFIFELFLYLLLTLDKAQLDFPYFEVRLYWKISLSFFFFIITFYFFLKNMKMKEHFF